MKLIQRQKGLASRTEASGLPGLGIRLVRPIESLAFGHLVRKRSELLAWIVTLHGVDPTAKDTDGHDVVYYAREAKLPNIRNWLYEHGAVRPPRTAPSVSVVDGMDAQAALDHKFANADVIDVDT